MMPKSNLPEYPLDEEEPGLDEPAPAPAAKPKPAAPAAEAKPAEPQENKKKFTKTYG